MNSRQPEFLSSTSNWENKHAKTVWTRYALILLGIWLLVNLPTFGITCRQLAWSDAISGVGLIIFGAFSLSAKNSWAPWITGLIGIWLQFAPLIYWSPTAFGYLNDTLAGIIAIALSLLIPGTPGMVEDTGPEKPLGWSYNPSAWIQRLPILLLASICWFISRYMAAFQLGYIDTIWDPISDYGTLNVITSSVSKAFPISAAGLEAAIYTFEALIAAKGSVRRWRTMPWIVTLFGVLVIPAGLVGIILIMLQPLIVGAWSFWSLLTAACMLGMIALTIDEVIATIQYFRQTTQRGHSFRKIFWEGGPALDDSEFDNPTPSLSQPSFELFFAAFRGVSLTWNLGLSMILGLWLLFHTGPYPAAVSLAHIFGALTLTFSIIATAEVMRSARFANVILGGFCILLPFILQAPTLVIWKAIIVGVLLIVLNLPKGKITEKYGAWQDSIR